MHIITGHCLCFFHWTNTWRNLIREPYLRRIMHLSLIFHTRIRTRRESVVRENRKRFQFALHGLKSFDDFLHLREMPSITTIPQLTQQKYVHPKCASIFIFLRWSQTNLFFRRFFSLLYFWFVYAWFVSMNTIEASEGKKCTMKIINNENDADFFFSKTNFLLLLFT